MVEHSLGGHIEPVLHNWAVSGMVHIKGHLLLLKLANGLVGTGFASRYRLQPRTGF